MSGNSTSSLNQILFEVTSEKISQLQTQKVAAEKYYGAVLAQADEANDAAREILILYNGIKDAPMSQKLNIDIQCARLFIENLENDLSTTDKLRNRYIKTSRNEIRYCISKCTYTYIFGKSLHDELDLVKNGRTDSDRDKEPAKEELIEREKTIKELQERIL